MPSKTKTIHAWHFCSIKDGIPVLRDGRPLKAIHQHNGEMVMCSFGLHASRRIIHAVRYAPGPYVCRVQCGGRVMESGDKLVCSWRKVEWGYDATKILRRFACEVTSKSLADRGITNIHPVIRQYLDTQDESLRNAAWSVAKKRNLICDAFWPQAWVAAWSTAWDVAWLEARNADWSVSCDVKLQPLSGRLEAMIVEGRNAE